MKNSGLLLILLILLVACWGNNDLEIIYYKSGKVKLECESKSGVRNGNCVEYYENGVVKLKTFWVDGELNGPFEEFFTDETTFKVGMMKSGRIMKMNIFFQSGRISEIRNYDSLGNILTVENYNENGTRDSLAYPYFYFPEIDSDTLSINKKATLKARIVNITNSIYENGQLILTSGFDSALNRISLDTITIIRPKDKLDYEYVFTPSEVGKRFIFGRFVFTKEDDVNIYRTQHEFALPYFVTNP